MPMGASDAPGPGPDEGALGGGAAAEDDREGARGAPTGVADRGGGMSEVRGFALSSTE
jgi:hypothetical protein